MSTTQYGSHGKGMHKNISMKYVSRPKGKNKNTVKPVNNDHLYIAIDCLFSLSEVIDADWG